MIRIWLLAAGLVLGAAFPLAALDEKKAASEVHDDASVKLTERQVEAGKFAVVDVGGVAFVHLVTLLAVDFVEDEAVCRRSGWPGRCRVFGLFQTTPYYRLPVAG